MMRQPDPARMGRSRVDSVPGVNPLDREQVPAAGTYRAGEAVWVHRHGRWNPGTVRGASPLAVLVDYHVVGQRGRLTDTIMELNIMRRVEADPLLDRHPVDVELRGRAGDCASGDTCGVHVTAYTPEPVFRP
jgi:hypothetical protein